MLHQLDRHGQRDIGLFLLALVLPGVGDPLVVVRAIVPRNAVQTWSLDVVDAHIEGLKVSNTDSRGHKELLHLLGVTRIGDISMQN